MQKLQTCLSFLHLNVVATACAGFPSLNPFAAPLTPVSHIDIAIHILELALLLLVLLLAAASPPPAPALALPSVCFLATATTLLA